MLLYIECIVLYRSPYSRMLICCAAISPPPPYGKRFDMTKISQILKLHDGDDAGILRVRILEFLSSETKRRRLEKKTLQLKAVG